MVPQGSLAIQIAPDLAFYFEELEEELERRLRVYLRYFCVTEPPESALIVSASGPKRSISEAETILHSESVRVCRCETTTFFEQPGIVAWCDASLGAAGRNTSVRRAGFR